jgi:hypothetical protein
MAKSAKTEHNSSYDGQDAHFEADKITFRAPYPPPRKRDVMPARNRVTPTGDIEAIPLRGAWTGNRGILHSGHEIVRFHASDLWITCALEFRGRRRDPLRSVRSL